MQKKGGSKSKGTLSSKDLPKTAAITDSKVKEQDTSRGVLVKNDSFFSPHSQPPPADSIDKTNEKSPRRGEGSNDRKKAFQRGNTVIQALDHEDVAKMQRKRLASYKSLLIEEPIAVADQKNNSLTVINEENHHLQ